ncbi:unnamed protein product, partial [Effrenium voratum]
MASTSNYSCGLNVKYMYYTTATLGAGAPLSGGFWGHPRMFKMFMGPKPMVVVTHPELARSVLTRPQDFIKSPPLDTMRGGIAAPLSFAPDGAYASLVMTNGAEWQAMRKPVDPAFEKAELRKFVPKFNEAAGKLMESWKGCDHIDVKRDMSRFALDVLGSAVLGRAFGAIDGTFDDTYRQYQIVMKELMNPLYLTFPALERLPFPRNTAYKKGIDTMYSMIEGKHYDVQHLELEPEMFGFPIR